MKSKKKFKIVYDHAERTYAIVTTDEQGEWYIGRTFITKADNNGMINVEILWRLEYLYCYLDYEFIGIKAINL